jgi:hypothetical protein
LIRFQRGDRFGKVRLCLGCFNVVCHDDGGGPSDSIVFHLRGLIVGSSANFFGWNSVLDGRAVDFYDVFLIFIHGYEEFVIMTTRGVLAIVDEAVRGRPSL